MVKKRKLLTREEILGVNAKSYLKKEEVFVEEWGGSVFVRELTAAEQRRVSRVSNDDDNAATRMIAICIVDENGDQIFSDEDAADLMQQGGRVLKMLVDKITEINGISDEMIREAQKNFESVQSEGLSSA